MTEEQPKKRTLTYYPQVFDTDTMEQARKVILTREGDTTTEERWEKETPYLVQHIGGILQLSAESVVMDYGCGIGRLAKALMETYQCQIIGVDQSKKMLALAEAHVDSPQFTPCTLDELETRLADPAFAVDYVYCVWVLQHCLKPQEDITRIKRSLKPNGLVYLLNTHRRCVPSTQGWINDTLNIEALMDEAFTPHEIHPVSPEAISQRIIDHSFCKTWRKP